MKKGIYIYVCLILSVFFYNCDANDENEYTVLSSSAINGAWTKTYTVDSIVMVFENSEMKRYVYQKNTTQPYDWSNYGKYTLRHYTKTGRTAIVYSVYVESTGERHNVDLFYTLSNDKLTPEMERWTRSSE